MFCQCCLGSWNNRKFSDSEPFLAIVTSSLWHETLYVAPELRVLKIAGQIFEVCTSGSNLSASTFFFRLNEKPRQSPSCNPTFPPSQTKEEWSEAQLSNKSLLQASLRDQMSDSIQMRSLVMEKGTAFISSHKINLEISS